MDRLGAPNTTPIKSIRALCLSVLSILDKAAFGYEILYFDAALSFHIIDHVRLV